jgi:DNA-binding NtrC family response regulator
MSNRQHPSSPPLIYVDDAAIRTLLVAYLRDEEFRVLEGKSGGEVLPTVQKDAPDVVLMDLRMPDQSGMQALESVHSHAPDIPVLIMTAYNSSSADTAGSQVPTVLQEG